MESTGAFTFQIINDKDKADIVATEMNDGNVSAAGEAESQTNLLTKRLPMSRFALIVTTCWTVAMLILMSGLSIQQRTNWAMLLD